MRKRIKHNDLLPWFTDDHRDLPPAYLKSCKEIFGDSLQASKPRAASRKQSSSKQQTERKKC
jgi:hypothetical protein